MVSVKKNYVLPRICTCEWNGWLFVSTMNFDFSLVFWLRNSWKTWKNMWFSHFASLRSKIIHFFHVFHLFLSQNTREKSKFIVSKYIATHFLHLCGNPSKKIVIVRHKNTQDILIFYMDQLFMLVTNPNIFLRSSQHFWFYFNFLIFFKIFYLYFLCLLPKCRKSVNHATS